MQQLLNSLANLTIPKVTTFYKKNMYINFKLLSLVIGITICNAISNFFSEERKSYNKDAPAANYWFCEKKNGYGLFRAWV
jgi:hypothetical protein